MIDSHCHLEFEDFDKEREEVIQRSKNELKAVVDSSAEIEKADEVLDLHKRHPEFIFPCLGLHPNGTIAKSNTEIEEYKDKIRDHRKEIVAIGEVGLDYHHISRKEKKSSKNVFREFVDLSNELDLPLVVHSRNAMEDTLDILEEKNGTTIIHCFAGDREAMEEAVSRNYYLSFGGIVFRMKHKYNDLLKNLSIDNILLETDAPFMAKRKEDRSEPPFIKEIAERIAEIKKTNFSEVWKTAGQNAVEAFDLPVDL